MNGNGSVKQFYYKAMDMVLLSFSALAIYVAWGFNKIVTPFVSSNIYGLAAISGGIILGLEGIVGIIIDPLSGYLTDMDIFYPKSTKRYFIMIGIPIMTLSLVILSYSNTVAMFVMAMLLFYVFAHFIRSPYNALMPEVVEKKHWGKASGYINAFFAIGSIIAYIVIAPIVLKNTFYGIVIAAVIIMIFGMATPLYIRESKNRVKKSNIDGVFSKILKSKTLLLFFFAQMFWWTSFEAIATYFYFYSKAMNFTLSGSSLIFAAVGFAIFNIATFIAAIPTGYLYERIFRKKNLIYIGIIVFIIAELLAISYQKSDMILLDLFIGGIGWAFILTASYPMGSYLIKKHVGGDNTPYGTFFGVTSIFANLAIITGAYITALVLYLSHDNLEMIFPVSISALFISGLLIMFMKISDHMNGEMGKEMDIIPMELD